MTSYFLSQHKVLFLIAMALFNSLFSKGQDTSIVNIGDNAPGFELLDDKSEMFRLSDHIGKKNMVIYFYPKDDTPGCTKEACGFRDEMELINNYNAMVIGISGDSPESHRDFKEKYSLPFTLISDPDSLARELYGVKNDFFGMIPGRVTFIIDKKGIIQYIYNSQTNAYSHVEEAMRILKELK